MHMVSDSSSMVKHDYIIEEASSEYLYNHLIGINETASSNKADHFGPPTL
jgi:hypothetical protein